MATADRDETGQPRKLFEFIDDVLDVASTIEADQPSQAARLRGICRSALQDSVAISPSIAAQLMGAEEKVVWSLMADGVLATSRAHPPALVEPLRLYDVLRLVRELRGTGEISGIAVSLWRGLEDQALLDREDLATSLAQARADDLRPARTVAEERDE